MATTHTVLTAVTPGGTGYILDSELRSEWRKAYGSLDELFMELKGRNLTRLKVKASNPLCGKSMESLSSTKYSTLCS